VNLVYGHIVEVFPDADRRMGKVRIGGVLVKISLDLLTDPRPGDKVLICEGVAIGRSDEPSTKEAVYVSGHTR
jgi:hydrogenase maturation factor